MNTLPNEEYEDEAPGIWDRIKARFHWGEYAIDEYDDPEYPPLLKRSQALRIHQSRASHVTVWMSVDCLEKATAAADGLKQGHQQIVNLEKASQEVSARVIDFLGGVSYALDGDVEKVGDRVYLFTPSNCVIDVNNGGPERKSKVPYGDA